MSEESVKKEIASVVPKNLEASPQIEKKKAGERRWSERVKMVHEVIHKMTETAAWDHVQAKDLDHRIIDFVSERISRGASASQISKELGLNPYGGKNSRQWRKIQAWFRQGFRADAETYLLQQTTDYYKIIQKTKAILEDAFENGVPIVEQTSYKDRDGNKQVETEVHYVKGATKELAAFIETYSRAIQTLPKLWKDYGAISEKPGAPGAGGSGGVTIVVKTNVPMPSQAEIDAYRQKLIDKSKPVIDVTPVKRDSQS